MMLADEIEIDLEHSLPKSVYDLGRFSACSGAQKIRCTWYLADLDGIKEATRIPFDLLEESPSLFVGLDVKRYANTETTKENNRIIFKRSVDTK